MSSYEPIAVPQSDQPKHAITPIEGGICAVCGLRAAGIHAGFRPDPERLDMALVVADELCTTAATFTTNRFCAAPVQVSRAHVANGYARAVVLNSGNANAATGDAGLQVAKATAAIVAEALACDAEDVLVASTGVIGVQLALDPFKTGVPAAVAALGADAASAHAAARAVMTTDTRPKEAAFELAREAGAAGDSIHVGGFVKGSGMIMPNMATMLSVIATDAPLTPEAASAALKAAVNQSFNKVTVDSDTSTNDTCILFATGKAAGEPIGLDSPKYEAVAEAIYQTCNSLARQIAADGEGATFLVTVDVLGAPTPEDADTVARAIANSPLVKTAIAGHDANWGRIAGAAGKCGVAFDQMQVDIDLFARPVLRGGLPVEFSEEEMLELFETRDEVPIAVDLHAGAAHTRVWSCDLTHGYITINGDYRT